MKMSSKGPDVPFSSRNSRTQCCVLGCRNAYYNTDNSIKFYSFPKRWFEKERRQIWINSMKSVCVEGTSNEWQPKDFHKICSAHFVGNEKSNNPKNPSYHPTIFPKDFKKLDKPTERIRRSKRKIAPSSRKKLAKEESPFPFPFLCGDKTVEISCQTDPSDLKEDIFLFECNFMDHSATGMCDVATQCNIADKTKLFVRKK